MADRETDKFLVTFSDTATFIFEWGDLTSEQIRGVLGDRGEGDALHIVQDRLIQRYFEAVDYDAEVLILPFSIMFWRNVRLKGDVPRGYRAEPLDQWELGLWKRTDDFQRWQKRPGRTICFFRKTESAASRLLREEYFPRMQFGFQMSGPGIQGHVIIDIEDIHVSVAFAKDDLAGLKTESHLTIKQVSEHFWPRITKNLKATIHNYLAGIPYGDKRPRIPVFCPEIRVQKGQNTGCQLSVSDIVLIGLLTGLFSRGVKSYDFATTKFLFMTPDEMADEHDVFLSESLPGHLFVVKG